MGPQDQKVYITGNSFTIPDDLRGNQELMLAEAYRDNAPDPNEDPFHEQQMEIDRREHRNKSMQRERNIFNKGRKRRK